MSETEARAATIRRGQAAALAELGKLDRETLAELVQVYKQARWQLQARWLPYAGVDGVIPVAALQDILNILAEVIDNLHTVQQGMLAGAVDAAGITGAGAVAAVTGVVGSHLSAVDAVLKLKQADGLQLSERLWKLDMGAKQAVSKQIMLALVRGDSAHKAARDFISQGLPVPPDVTAGIKEGSIANLGKISGEQLMTGQGSALSNAQRLFRTEMGRAHTLAFIDSTVEVDGVVGYRYRLSPRHRRTDICDLHAKANLYGMGPGVYPTAVIRRIFPAHPNTTSYVTAVFADEITEKDKAKDASRIEWLQGQSETVQVSILGKQKAAWLQAGKLTENTISSSVADLKKRFDRYS